MKMVKSLLLGGAAGLLAVAGAQAADMPVKAKAVAYVKICSLYGDGYYYIPGTDTCLRIYGFVRNQHYYGQYTSSATNGPFFGNGGAYTRSGSQTDYIIRSRTMFYLDARTQTEYGTLRSVLTAGFTFDSPNTAAAAGPYANRAFIQLAGFTFGQAQSYYDFFSSPIVSYFGLVGQSDTGDGGWKVAAYTFQAGNGVSLTLSLEEARRIAANSATSYGGLANVNIVNAFSQISTGSNGAAAGGTILSNQNYVAERAPDVVATLRVDQAWGAAQIMAALHDASGAYYGNSAACAGTVAVQASGTLLCGNPPDKWGFAVGGGLRINAPGGDFFQTQVNYTEGALKYASNTPMGGAQASAMTGVAGAGTFALGIATDGLYALLAPGVGTTVQLTTAWSAAASFQHVWSPKFQSSIYGTYTAVSFNPLASLLICANIALSAPTAGGLNGVPAACNPNWQVWEVGSRHQWNVTPGLYVGVDVLYRKLETGFIGSVLNYSSNTPRPTGAYAARDQDAWIGTFRAHRDF